MKTFSPNIFDNPAEKAESFRHCGICGQHTKKEPFVMGIVYSVTGPEERVGICRKCAASVQEHILYLKTKTNWHNSDVDD